MRSTKSVIFKESKSVLFYLQSGQIMRSRAGMEGQACLLKTKKNFFVSFLALYYYRGIGVAK